MWTWGCSTVAQFPGPFPAFQCCTHCFSACKLGINGPGYVYEASSTALQISRTNPIKTATSHIFDLRNQRLNQLKISKEVSRTAQSQTTINYIDKLYHKQCNESSMVSLAMVISVFINNNDKCSDEYLMLLILFDAVGC